MIIYCTGRKCHVIFTVGVGDAYVGDLQIS